MADRIVHVVANGVRGDSRVLKSAQTSKNAGLDTVLLGLSTTEDTEQFVLEGIQVVLVPVVTVGGVASKKARTTKSPRAPRDMREWAKFGARLAIRDRPKVRSAIRRARGISTPEPVQEEPTPEPTPSVLNRLGKRGKPSADWAKPVPRLHPCNEALARGLVNLAPDIVHVHDSVPLVAGVAYARLASEQSREVRILYDAHEWTEALARIDSAPPSYLAMSEIEEAFIGDADGVITVSVEIAREIQRRYDLPKTPGVVLNAPTSSRALDAPNLRELINVPADAPLLVYSGWVDPKRGVGTAIRALQQLPQVHLALVVGRRNEALSMALEDALALGVADRVHVAPYVLPSQVTQYLSSADIGLIPFSASEHLDMSLPTKLREYLHAGLAIVASDNKLVRQAIESWGIGQTFVAGEVSGLVAAITQVVEDLETYKNHITPELLREQSWEAQEAPLLRSYEGLGAHVHAITSMPTTPQVAQDQPSSGGGRLASVSLAIGPTNSAGQAGEWCRAAAEEFGITAESFGRRESVFGFQFDLLHPRTPQSMAADAERLLNTHSHLLIEACNPVLTTLRRSDIGDEISLIRRRAVHLGLIMHGSEIRQPQRHLERLPESYFSTATDEWLERINRVVRRNEEILSSFDGPVFVSTPDLLIDVPHATWLPVVVNVEQWSHTADALEQNRIPVVLHAPSRSVPPIKGSDIVVPVLEELHAAGRNNFLSPEHVSNSELRRLVWEADIVVDQIRTGSYGVAAVEAMAAGRLVIGAVAPDVRMLLPDDVPIVDSPGLQFKAVMDTVLGDLPHFAHVARRGPEYAKTWHDGRKSAQALLAFLSLRIPPTGDENFLPRG
jgi:glycosyltransferase involved in cell wall biosynthesis